MDITLSALATEYVRVSVTATSGGVSINPTSDPVSFAFTTSVATTPSPSDWVAASWDPGGSGTYTARCLVGPGGSTVLSSGNYFVWVKITDSPEVPVRQVGTLTVF